MLVEVLISGPEPGTEAARAREIWNEVAAGREAMIQPPHWPAEVAAVLARLSPATVERDVDDLCAMSVPTFDGVEVYRAAAWLAVELDHHLFDTLYHAVALESGSAVLITADERYYRKAWSRGRIVQLADHVGGIA